MSPSPSQKFPSNQLINNNNNLNISENDEFQLFFQEHKVMHKKSESFAGSFTPSSNINSNKNFNNSNNNNSIY